MGLSVTLMIPRKLVTAAETKLLSSFLVIIIDQVFLSMWLGSLVHV